MKEIPLTQGKVAIVDDEDYELAVQFRWIASKIGKGDKWYATRTEYPKKTIYLHRLILNAPAGSTVDHKDGDGLNNCRGNLRVCSHAENVRNAKKPSTNTSGYKGVYLQRNSRWIAHISINSRCTHIGSFDTAEDAARAYDAVAVRIYGEFAKTNF